MRKFGVIGKTLTHSFSPGFFSKKFRSECIQARYDAYELSSLSNFKTFVIKGGFSGLNVTIPFKEVVMPLLDEISREAEEIGAVNTIHVKNNELKGYNTDVIGFEMALTKLIGNSAIKKALILGTGGASKAVHYVCRKKGIIAQFVSRSSVKGFYSYQELNQEIIAEHKLIINTTPLGTYPNLNEFPDIPYFHLNASHYCMDLVYNPEETLFMKKCKEKGALAQNGLAMLHGQALASWDIWNS